MSEPSELLRKGPALPAYKRALLVRLLSGRLPAPLARRVRRALERDPEWLAAYDALREAERAAAGSPPVTEGQIELFERLVLDEVAPPARARRAKTAALALVAFAAALLVFFALPRAPAPEWTPRSVPGAEAPVGARVRCVASSEGGARVLASAVLAPGRPEAALTCPPDGLLAFSVTNLSGAPRHVFIVGITEDDALRFYAPFTRGAASVRIAPGTSAHLLETLAALEDLPDAGKEVTLFAVFTDAPLSGERLEALLKDARGRDVSLSRLDRLPVPKSAQGRARLSIEAEDASPR